MKDFPQLPTDTVIYAIGYARVSDRKQEEEGESLETQDKAIRQYATKQGWILLDVVKEVFSGYYLRESETYPTHPRSGPRPFCPRRNCQFLRPTLARTNPSSGTSQ